MQRNELVVRFGIQQYLHWTVVGLLIPVIILIFQSRGLNLTEVGIVMAVWIGSTTILEIPVGGLADTIGRKKTYSYSLVLTLLGCLNLLYANSLSSILISAMFLGASRAVYSGTLDAWFYDAFSRIPGDNSYHTAMAKVNVFVTVGLATGCLLGGVLPNSMVSSYFESFDVYDISIFVTSVSSIILLFLTRLLLPHEQRSIKVHHQNTVTTAVQTSIKALTFSLNHWTLRLVIQATLIFGAAMSAVENLWQPYLSELMGLHSKDLTLFGIISALYFLMAALSSIVSVPLLKVFGGSHKALMFVTRALAGLSLILLANTNNTMSFALLYLTFFFLLTMGNNSEQVLLNENTPEEMRSTILSISSFAVTGGGVLASLASGFISEYYGISLSWILCGSVLLISSLYFLGCREVIKTESV
ncbi:MFS transporter [Vibrio lentus]|uniref:MFS transporter n=2 Tax=Vibrio lentus TaxID=136468 RepID=A0A2N7BI02_9VIBR|nr:MFS transporter [Vibrio lentus]PME49463.1 MFS transporter [Vibrio lentus]PME55304.1 MFS transporter [Vibrio lentus]PME77321.1 MFS transporter [Vibrio lentus]PMG65779.1 MFS transporter [Vibrio lentus]PMH93537.1 MFS transporter [Vibrio lentus]